MESQRYLSYEDVQLLTEKENWIGSYYELAFTFRNANLNRQDRLRLLNVLWHVVQPGALASWFSDFDTNAHLLELVNVNNGYHYYGTISIQQRLLGCSSVFLTLGGSTQCCFYIPLSMLEKVYVISYPLKRENDAWMKDMDRILAMIGLAVYNEMPFDLAALGEEASSIPIEYIIKNIDHETGLLLSGDFFDQVGIEPKGTMLSDRLWWIE